MGETTYLHDDGKTPIRIERGLHGIGSQFAAGEQLLLADAFGDGLHNDSTVDPLFIPYGSMTAKAGAIMIPRQANGRSVAATYNSIPVVEFISFGRSHRYPLSAYGTVAPLWRDRLLTEARILARAIQDDHAIAQEFLEPNGSVIAALTIGARAVADLFSPSPHASPSEYETLIQRAWSCEAKVRDGTADDYGLLHSAGIELTRIRHSQKQLTARVQARLASLIDTAKTSETVATEVEGTAFWLLDLYGQAMFEKHSPMQLFAYRVGVLLVRSGARYVGERVADRAARHATWEACRIIRQELPRTIGDLFLTFMKKGFDKPDELDATEQFVVELIGIQIWFAFFTIDYYAYEVQDLPPEKRGSTDAYFDKLAPAFADEMVAAISRIAGAGKRFATLSDANRTLGKRFAYQGLPALITAFRREWSAVEDIAKRENRDWRDVVPSELGGALYRTVRDVAKAMSEDRIKKKMQQGIIEDRAMWLSLILSLKVATWSPDGPTAVNPKPPSISEPRQPDRLPTRWDKSLPKTKPGPDKDGRVGLDKLASTPGKVAAARSKTAKKPTAKERRGVKPSARHDRTGDETARASTLPDHAKVWRDRDHNLVIESRVATPPGRKHYEREMWRGVEVGLEGWDRAHSQGNITGYESREGILYAPEEANRVLQKHVEEHIAELFAQRADDVELYLTTVTSAHPGTLRLREIQYKLEAKRPGDFKRTRLYEMQIEIADRRVNPTVTVSGQPYGDWEQFLKPVPSHAEASSP